MSFEASDSYSLEKISLELSKIADILSDLLSVAENLMGEQKNDCNNCDSGCYCDDE